MELTKTIDYLRDSLDFLKGILESPKKQAWCRGFSADVPADFQKEVGEFLLRFKESGLTEGVPEITPAGEDAPAAATTLVYPLTEDLSALSDAELKAQLAGLVDGDSPFVLYGMSSGLLYRLYSEFLSRKEKILREGYAFRLAEGDLPELSAFCEALFPENGEAVCRTFAGQLSDEKAALFGFRNEKGLTALAHGRIRSDYVEGADNAAGRVAYLEGLYRKEGTSLDCALKLTDAISLWAREKGCRELAADCAEGDDEGAALRTMAGFTETARIICYIKTL